MSSAESDGGYFWFGYRAFHIDGLLVTAQNTAIRALAAYNLPEDLSPDDVPPNKPREVHESAQLLRHIIDVNARRESLSTRFPKFEVDRLVQAAFVVGALTATIEARRWTPDIEQGTKTRNSRPKGAATNKSLAKKRGTRLRDIYSRFSPAERRDQVSDAKAVNAIYKSEFSEDPIADSTVRSHLFGKPRAKKYS